jgi:hypothetical protein
MAYGTDQKRSSGWQPALARATLRLLIRAGKRNVGLLKCDGTLAARSRAKISTRPASRVDTRNLADFTGVRNGSNGLADSQMGSNSLIAVMSAEVFSV